MEKTILFSWSGGKDSALALHEMLKTKSHNIILFSTFTQDFRRITMHGVREELIEAQAKALSLPLEKLYIPANCPLEEYNALMHDAMSCFKARGITACAFGDIALEDVKGYREENLNSIGMKALFPLWGRSTKETAQTFIDLGFKSIITCVDTQALPLSFAGRLFDNRFLADLPKEADPSGEWGEFHSFVFDGPIFSRPVTFTVAQKLLRDNRFYYCDLIST